MNLVRILILFFLIFMAFKQKNRVTKDMLLILTGLLAVCMIDKSEGYEGAKSIQLDNWGVSDNDLGLNDDDKKRTQAGDGRDIFDFSELPESAGPATNSDIAGYFEGSILHLEPGKTNGISCTDENDISGVVEWRIGMDSLKNTITYSDYFPPYSPNSTVPMRITLGPAEVTQETSTPNKDKIDTLLTCKISNKFKCPRDILPGGDVISNESLPIKIVTNPLNTCNNSMYPIDGTQPVSGSPSPDIKDVRISDKCKIYNVNEWSDFYNNCCVSLTSTGDDIIPPPSVCDSPPSGPNYCNYENWWAFDIFIILLPLISAFFTRRTGMSVIFSLMAAAGGIFGFIKDLLWKFATSDDIPDCYKPLTSYHQLIDFLNGEGVDVDNDLLLFSIIYGIPASICIIIVIIVICKKGKISRDSYGGVLAKPGVLGRGDISAHPRAY